MTEGEKIGGKAPLLLTSINVQTFVTLFSRQCLLFKLEQSRCRSCCHANDVALRYRLLGQKQRCPLKLLKHGSYGLVYRSTWLQNNNVQRPEMELILKHRWNTHGCLPNDDTGLGHQLSFGKIWQLKRMAVFGPQEGIPNFKGLCVSWPGRHVAQKCFCRASSSTHGVPSSPSDQSSGIFDGHTLKKLHISFVMYIWWTSMYIWI